MPNSIESPEFQVSTIPFSPYLLQRAHELSVVLDACDETIAEDMVNELNRDAVYLGVVGEQARLDSDITIQTRYSLNPTTNRFEPVQCVDNSVGDAITGQFVGFILYNYEGQLQLMYQLGTPVGEGLLTYDIVDAPVEEAEIALLDAEQLKDIKDGRAMVAHIETLSKVEDSTFQADIYELLQILENDQVQDAQALSKVGNIAARFLNKKFISKFPQVLPALASILQLHLSDHDLYSIFGHAVRKIKEGDKKLLNLDLVKITKDIDRITMIDYYDYDPETKATFIEGKGQLALVVKDNVGSELFMPLRFLQSFDRAWEIDMSCPESLGRFRDAFFRKDVEQ